MTGSCREPAWLLFFRAASFAALVDMSGVVWYPAGKRWARRIPCSSPVMPTAVFPCKKERVGVAMLVGNAAGSRGQAPPGPRALLCPRPANPMAPWKIVAAGVLVLASAAAQAGPVEVNVDLPRSPFVAVGQAVRPAVVSIRITRAVGVDGMDRTPLQELHRRFFPERPGEGGRFEQPGTGSGFVVDPSGKIITNHHVIQGADRIFVRFAAEHGEYPAELVGSDPLTDLALLSIDPGPRSLPYLVFGDSESLEVGDWVIAVGNPFGNLEGTMTVGILSATGRGDLSIQGLTPRYQDFLQTDASINVGNSGGPLVDVRGRVIGVNTAINVAGQGIGFAVPSRLARVIYEHLDSRGRVVRGWLGAVARDGERGVRIDEIVSPSPASKAGLQPGDHILAFGDKPIATQRQLQFLVAEAPLDVPLACLVERDGRRVALSVTLSEMDLQRIDAMAGGHWLGLEVADLADSDQRVLRLKNTLGINTSNGVVILVVEAGRPGVQAGLRPGDVIVAIEDRDLPDLAAWEAARAALEGGREPLNMLVRTGTSERFVKVTPRDAGTLQ